MSDSSLINNIQAENDLPHPIQEILTATGGAYPWLRHYEKGVPPELIIPDRPLTWLLDTSAQRYPNHIACLYYGTKITYAQLSNQANRFAIGLQRAGVQKEDRVALALPNIPQFLIAFYGALRAGAVVVPTNPLYTGHEMQHQLTDSGARILVMLDTFYPVVRTIRDQTPLEHIIITSPSDFFPPLLRMLYPLKELAEQRKRQKRQNNQVKSQQLTLTAKELADDSMLLSMQSLLNASTHGGVELFNLPVSAQGDDLAVLQYTGGTTGLSKGAMLTHRNLLANAMQTRYWTPQVLDTKESTLCVAPFFHAYGLTVGMNLSILAGATMILLPRFNAKEVVKTIHRYRPSLLPGIPTMYIALMRAAEQHPDYLKSIKYCISGSAPLPSKVQTDFETITHGKLVEGYGLSEAAPVTHCNPLTDQCRNGSVGLPLPNVEAAILDQVTGEFLPAGEVGEIVVRGPNVMKGYWQCSEETEAIFVNGWMRTGDVGSMDADGYFYVVDRTKDLIIASGFNVYPREVEEVLFQHPAISEAAVTGVSDAYRGETVAAFVVLKDDIEPSDATKQSILTFCKQQLTAYKVPKRLEFRASLPRSAIGKVLRRELHPTMEQV